jgi:hypothetical protein
VIGAPQNGVEYTTSRLTRAGKVDSVVAKGAIVGTHVAGFFVVVLFVWTIVRPLGVIVAFCHIVQEGIERVKTPDLVTVFLFAGVTVVTSDIVTVKVLARRGG